MFNLIQEILSGKNRALQHDAQLLHRAKQCGYIVETPTGYLIVTDEYYATMY